MAIQSLTNKRDQAALQTWTGEPWNKCQWKTRATTPSSTQVQPSIQGKKTLMTYHKSMQMMNRCPQASFSTRKSKTAP